MSKVFIPVAVCHACAAPPELDRFGFPHFFEYCDRWYCRDCAPSYLSPFEPPKLTKKAEPVKATLQDYWLALDALTESKRSLKELCAMLEIDNPAARAVIAELRADGYPVECWREGRHYFYAIDKENAKHAH